MVQATKERQCDDSTLLGRFDWTRLRAILLQRSMRPTPAMIVNIVGQQAGKGLRMKHEHLVEALAPEGADEPFHKRVLPGRTGGNGLFLQAQGEGPRLEFTAVNAVAIAQQVAGWVGVGNSLGALLSRLGDRRRIRYIVELGSLPDAAVIISLDDQANSFD
jgi:hypothetical protein